MSENKNWYALYTKPKQELKASKEFLILGIEYYLPLVTRIKQWSDRKKKINEPLLKGYIFVKVNEKERLLAMQQSPIVKTVNFSGVPAIVPDWEIENLRKMLSKQLEVKIEDNLKKGTKVKVLDGPFKDIEGFVYETPNNDKELAVIINALKRSIVVTLPPECVIKKIDD